MFVFDTILLDSAFPINEMVLNYGYFVLIYGLKGKHSVKLVQNGGICKLDLLCR